MITGFQFKAALAIITITAKELSNIIDLHQATLLRFKHTANLEYLNCHTKNIILLNDFFSEKNIYFPNHRTIQFTKIISEETDDNSMLNRFQLVTSRIATGLSQRELSRHLRISAGAISLLEQLDNSQLIVNRKIRPRTLKTFFEHLGIMFLDPFTVSLAKDPSLFFKKNSNVD